jgi:hypothetical protein
VLYNQARQAAAAKSNPGNSRRPGLPSQRRPWSTEEENALMEGLDLVKGPHWSQILAIYGAGGSKNDILRDRNQVQLKDKARNLKLFFLKSNIEVPYYLSQVTGELKTRAPSQALRKELEEKSRLELEGNAASQYDAFGPPNGMQNLPQSFQPQMQAPDGNSPEIPLNPNRTDGINSPEKLHVIAPAQHPQSHNRNLPPALNSNSNDDEEAFAKALLAASELASDHSS